jgi:Zn-dependent protease
MSELTLLSVRGVPVRVHVALVVMIGLLAGLSGWRLGGAAAAQTLAFAVGLLASVTAHEVGHAAMAARFGIPAVAIVLTPMGGAVQMVRCRVPPSVDVAVALAGPLTSLALAGVTGALWAASGLDALRVLAALNLGLGVFNLVPAMPLDGGRVLRGLLVARLGLERGARVALAVAVLLTAALAIVGFVTGQLALLTVCLFMALLQRREWVAQRRGYARELPVMGVGPSHGAGQPLGGDPPLG